MIHYCIVKYGNECHYQNVEELLKNITEPVHDSCLDIKFHLLTDRRSDVVPNYNKHYEYFREYYALHEDAGSTRIVGGEQNFVQEMIELTGTIELMPPTFVMKSNWPKDNKDYFVVPKVVE